MAKKKVAKKIIVDIPAKSHMLTLRVTSEELGMIELVKRIIGAERTMGSNEPTRSEAVGVLLQWGWKVFSEQRKEAIEALKSVKKKSA